jgi:hypothetical protein
MIVASTMVPVAFEVNIHRFQHRSAKVVFFQQMPKLAHLRFVRRRFVAKINLRKVAHQRRVVQRFFHR